MTARDKADWRLVRDDTTLYRLCLVLFGPAPESPWDRFDQATPRPTASPSDTHKESTR